MNSSRLDGMGRENLSAMFLEIQLHQDLVLRVTLPGAYKHHQRRLLHTFLSWFRPP